MRTITYDETQWQLVPKEPTRSMILDGQSRMWSGIRPAYEAMLAAAPQPPATTGKGEKC